MKIVYSLIIFSILFSCNKPTNSTDNTPTDNLPKDSLNNDLITAGLTNFPNVAIRTSFSCCMKVIWGDGIITNYPSLNQTAAVRDSTGSISHNYLGSSTDSYPLQVSAKSITYFAMSGIGNSYSDYVITNLNASKCPSLYTLSIRLGECSQINVRNCLKLSTLICSDNYLDTIFLDMNKSLRNFDCHNNKIYKLDLKNNIKLYDIDCSNNKLSVLTVTEQKLLTNLNCSKNNLISLNISSNSDLMEIDCSSNKLSDTAINRIFDSLPTNIYNSNNFKIDIKNNPGALTCNTISKCKRMVSFH